MTSVDGVVFPQDPGNADIAEQEADFSSAGHFAGHLARENVDSYKQGCEVTADFDNDTFSVTAGLVYISDERVVQVQDLEGEYTVDWSEGTSLVVQVPEVTGVAFDGTADFDVFVVVDPVANNEVSVEQLGVENVPTNPYLKIARIRQEESEQVSNTYDSPEASHSVESVSQIVRDGEELVIPEDESRVVVDGYTVEGELQVDGTLKVI